MAILCDLILINFHLNQIQTLHSYFETTNGNYIQNFNSIRQTIWMCVWMGSFFSLFFSILILSITQLLKTENWMSTAFTDIATTDSIHNSIGWTHFSQFIYFTLQIWDILFFFSWMNCFVLFCSWFLNLILIFFSFSPISQTYYTLTQ